MGDIKKPRKKYERPYKPWDRRVLEETNRLCGYYGLRNKRELWRMSYLAKKYRRIARQLLAAPESERVKIEPIIRKLQALGILGKDATLDDLLDLSVEQFL
ncbi:MAG: 30S ribosomal protein S4, partial [Candidatus Korarchaeum sp.]